LNQSIAHIVPYSSFPSDPYPARDAVKFPSITIKIEYSNDQTYDVNALLDSGASSSYISLSFITKHGFTTKPLKNPIHASNADGSSNTHITRKVQLVCHYLGHSSAEWLYVANIEVDVILGAAWLRSHNPEIDWRLGKVTFTRCPLTCLRNNASNSLRDLLENASVVTNYPSSFPDTINRMVHVSNTKAGISTQLAIEELKNKKVLTLDDIKKGPFADFADIFEEENFQELPPHRLWDHKIDLKEDWETKKWKPRVYPLNYDETKELDKFLDENLASGRIRPSESPLASPVFFIDKKDGNKRMVIDYRRLNDITVKNAYPLPLIPELITKWKGCKFFSALDVRSGYYNIRMREGDEWKTAFICPRGLYESLVMTFGLCNAPATFPDYDGQHLHGLHPTRRHRRFH
jgi:hypothetical protein